MIPDGLAEGGIAEGMGHLIMMEQPEKLASACLKFLKIGRLFKYLIKTSQKKFLSLNSRFLKRTLLTRFFMA